MEMSEVIGNWAEKIPLVEENRNSLEELCRLCGTGNRNLISLFGSGVDNDLRRKIEMHLPIELCENDGFPQKVCYFCASTVLSFNDIYESINEVEENFNRLLKEETPTKQVVCGKKVMEFDSRSPESRKQHSQIKPDLGNLSVRSGQVERSLQQDREIISRNKMDSGITNGSFRVYEHSDASALLDDLENGIIDSQLAVSSNPNAAISIIHPGATNNQQITRYTGSVAAQYTQTFDPGARFRGSRYLKTEGSFATMMISSEVLNMLEENSHDNDDSQTEFDHDVLPDSNDSKTFNQYESSASCSEYVYTQQQRPLDKTCRYKYRLKIIRNGRNMVHVFVRWQKFRNDGVFKCKHCTCSFHIATVLLTHSRFHTRQAPFYCKYCGQSFMLCGSLKYHREQCIKMKQHIQIAHSPHQSSNLYTSDNSNRNSFYNSVNSNHSANSEDDVSENLNEGRYICELCGKNYKLRATLKEHLMHHLGKGRRKLKCEKCFVKFLTRSELVEHLKCHNDNLVCKLCDKVVLNEKDLQIHLVSHSSLRPYSCYICGVSYKRKSHMTRHLLTHNPERSKKHDVEQDESPDGSLICDECGIVASSWRSLRAHMKRHKEQKYECDVCGKRFAQPSGVTRHKHTVHNKARDFTCDQCKQCFSTKATLVNHLRIHTGERPHQCTTCGKTFRTRQQQKMHEKIHSDVFPFQCEHCPKKFRRKLHLVVHIRTHTGEKPYVCPICGRGFTQCNDRKKHMNIHR